MTREESATLYDLRKQGYAVLTFSPLELRGADRECVEGRLCELGNEVIDDLATLPDPDQTDNEG